MPFKPGDPKPPTSGRKPGGLNKTTRVLKEVLEAVLAEPETEGRLRALRDSDEPADRAAFWRLAGRLVPNAVEARVEGVREVVHRIHVGPKPDSDQDEPRREAQ